ncbi:MAG: DUF5990 family protein [Acidobacteriota bacterium]
MDVELTLRIILETPPSGVDFALQKGRGNSVEVVQKQRSTGKDLNFEFTARVKPGTATLLGPFVQGPPTERFVYIGIGTCVGQADSPWTRRLKVPLRGITVQMIESQKLLEARVPGTDKKGEPTCATVKPFAGWH